MNDTIITTPTNSAPSLLPDLDMRRSRHENIAAAHQFVDHICKLLHELIDRDAGLAFEQHYDAYRHDIRFNWPREAPSPLTEAERPL
jgi:hypothetical protein